MKHFLLSILILAIIEPIFSQHIDKTEAKTATKVHQVDNTVLKRGADQQSSYLLHFNHQREISNELFFEKEDIRVGNAYPNPTVAQATIDYSILAANLQASIVIHNLLGNKMMELPLDRSQNSLKISTENFNSGVYFYSLYVNDKRAMTKKLVVKK